MSFWIPRRDTELRFVGNLFENQPLQSCRGRLDYHTKTLELRGTRPILHMPITPKIA